MSHVGAARDPFAPPNLADLPTTPMQMTPYLEPKMAPLVSCVQKQSALKVY